MQDFLREAIRDLKIEDYIPEERSLTYRRWLIQTRALLAIRPPCNQRILQSIVCQERPLATSLSLQAIKILRDPNYSSACSSSNGHFNLNNNIVQLENALEVEFHGGGKKLLLLEEKEKGFLYAILIAILANF